MKVILISAKSQHGKDTIASIIKEELISRNERPLIIHFGDAVKFFAKEFYSWDGIKDKRGRGLLQYIGTTLMRNYDKYYWGNIVSSFIAANNFENDFTYAIIPDWRFYSEEQAIKKQNLFVYTIRINRYNQDGSLYKNPNMTDEQYNHISETELDNNIFDYVIKNDKNLQELKEKTIQILDQIYEL